MGNHIHFLIKPGEGGALSEIMQWIKLLPKRGIKSAAGRGVYGRSDFIHA
jgi:REP element-mobilizing transposase RayT